MTITDNQLRKPKRLATVKTPRITLRLYRYWDPVEQASYYECQLDTAEVRSRATLDTIEQVIRFFSKAGKEGKELLQKANLPVDNQTPPVN